MSRYSYFEIKDKMTELSFTHVLLNYLFNAKRELDYALTRLPSGVLDEDAEFEKKLRAVFYELDELGVIVIRAYNKDCEKFLKDLTNRVDKND